MTARRRLLQRCLDRLGVLNRANGVRMIESRQAHLDSRLQTTIHHSIDELPEGLWDGTMGHDHPMKSACFIRVLEQAFPERRFAYMVVRNGDRVVGVSWLSYMSLDISFYLD